MDEGRCGAGGPVHGKSWHLEAETEADGSAGAEAEDESAVRGDMERMRLNPSAFADGGGITEAAADSDGGLECSKPLTWLKLSVFVDFIADNDGMTNDGIAWTWLLHPSAFADVDAGAARGALLRPDFRTRR